jgi:hypothetical protein
MVARFYKNCCSFFFLLLWLAFFTQAGAQSPSPLAKGQWHKLGIREQGVYKLTQQYLQQQGIINSSTNPQFIRIYGQGGGMLPQANAAVRPEGLQENAIFVAGQADGRFDEQDYILFYAQGPDRVAYNTLTESFDYEKNIYSDTAWYFITVADEKGLRMASNDNLSVSQPLITQYTAYAALEEDKLSLLKSGRNWLGDQFGYEKTKTYQLPLRHIAPDGELHIRTAFVGSSTAAAHFKVYVNKQLAHQQDLPAIKDPGRNQYAEKGKSTTQESVVPGSGFAKQDQLSIKLEYEGSSSGGGAYLDYIFASVRAELVYEGSPLFFRAPQSLQHPASRFEVKGGREGLELWDLSHPQQPMRQKYSLNGNSLQFGTTTGSLREFVVFNPANAFTPINVKKVPNQNLRSDLSPELVILTHSSLLAEAERLAAFRRQHEGLRVKVATVQQVYNEFSSGAQDVSAIRDYMRYLYTKGGKLRYLLLFGRGYYDYKNRTDRDYNLVPVYQSYNSTHPVLSYSSDDYYGFLEDDEGSWPEDDEGNHSLDIGIGRLPVVSLSEARQVVDKLIRYQTSPETMGSWRNRILFIAEDGDNNVHQQDAERLADLVQEGWPAGNIHKIYLGAYPQVKLATGARAPRVTEAINEAVDRGALIINYTGHGSQDVLTKKLVITKSFIDSWQNKNRLPLVITATCEFGQHDDRKRSGAEHMLLNPEGGAIGLFTAARPVYSHTNYEINSAFYKFTFSREPNGSTQRLGDIIRQTKNRGIPLTGVINRNFLLLGDPSMRIAHPTKEINISRLQYEEDGASADTLGAFARVQATGTVLDAQGHTDASFNGILEAVVYEKTSEYETIDPETPLLRFKLQNKLIFRGQATVEQGLFSFGFVVPKNIRYTIGQGKISLYAVDTSKHIDAGGEFRDFFIGGGSNAASADETPPTIQVFLNDSSFRSGQTVGTKSMLLAYFQDKSGINITDTGIQEGVVATLDGQSSFLLNDYYMADPDDYTKGRLQYPLQSLAPGRHTLRISARDAYNNIGHSEIQFIVSDHKAFEIYSLRNYPNPFRESTRIVAEHSRAGEDVEARLWIYNLGGALVHQEQHTIPQSMREIKLPAWHGEAAGKKLPAGIYLFKIMLRSLTDGSISEKTEKLVILN